MFGPLDLLFVADVFEDAKVGDGLDVCRHCLHQCADLFVLIHFEGVRGRIGLRECKKEEWSGKMRIKGCLLVDPHDCCKVGKASKDDDEVKDDAVVQSGKKKDNPDPITVARSRGSLGSKECP